MKITGVPFKQANEFGDFKWMITQPEYHNVLFVYNDNFLDSMQDEPRKGGGSAVIRPYGYKYSDSPRAAGIPTGWFVKGFDCLDFYVKRAIDSAFHRIKLLLKENSEFTEIMFACDPSCVTKIGCKLFNVHSDVIDYISQQLQNLGTFDSDCYLFSHAEIDLMEDPLKTFAILLYENYQLKNKINKLQQETFTDMKRSRYFR